MDSTQKCLEAFSVHQDDTKLADSGEDPLLDLLLIFFRALFRASFAMTCDVKDVLRQEPG